MWRASTISLMADKDTVPIQYESIRQGIDKVIIWFNVSRTKCHWKNVNEQNVTRNISHCQSSWVLTSHSTHNKAFQRQVFPGNRFHRYWQFSSWTLKSTFWLIMAGNISGALAFGLSPEAFIAHLKQKKNHKSDHRLHATPTPTLC